MVRQLKFRTRKRGDHYDVTMFESPGAGYTFACCGTLTMREPEYRDLRDLILAGRDNVPREIDVVWQEER